jgi:hypothetical protein
MTLKSTTATLLLAAALPLVAASPQAKPPSTPPAEKAQLPKGQMPVLGRATRPDDPMPLLDFDTYFIGRWTFDWQAPESVLGSAGLISGTTVYKALGNGFYQGETQATGPDGAFTIHEVIAYQRDNRTAARHVSDSRGFSYLQSAKVGGDLGGYFNIHFESAPFTYKDKVLRIRNSMRLMSPLQYRNVVTLSVDSGPFLNMSDPWWKRDPAAASGNR